MISSYKPLYQYGRKSKKFLYQHSCPTLSQMFFQGAGDDKILTSICDWYFSCHFLNIAIAYVYLWNNLNRIKKCNRSNGAYHSPLLLCYAAEQGDSVLVRDQNGWNVLYKLSRAAIVYWYANHHIHAMQHLREYRDKRIVVDSARTDIDCHSLQHPTCPKEQGRFYLIYNWALFHRLHCFPAAYTRIQAIKKIYEDNQFHRNLKRGIVEVVAITSINRAAKRQKKQSFLENGSDGNGTNICIKIEAKAEQRKHLQTTDRTRYSVRTCKRNTPPPGFHFLALTKSQRNKLYILLLIRVLDLIVRTRLVQTAYV